MDVVRQSRSAYCCGEPDFELHTPRDSMISETVNLLDKFVFKQMHSEVLGQNQLVSYNIIGLRSQGV